MDKTLTQLSDDYFKAAQDMDSMIKKCTVEIHQEEKKGYSMKLCMLKRKRLIFYSQKRDLITTAYKLKNYYNKENDLLESA